MKRSPQVPERSNAAEAVDNANHCALAAWRSLALAGQPRCPKKQREDQIEAAWKAVDRARGHCTTARRWLLRLSDLVTQKETRKAKGRERFTDSYSGEEYWVHPDGATAHEKAGVTSLRPQVRDLSRDLINLGECLKSFRRERRRPPHSLEIEEAERCKAWIDRLAVALVPGLAKHQTHHCHWCGVFERTTSKYDQHVPLDGEGFAIERNRATRFCCDTCFRAGADLAEPSPRPIEATVAVVAAGPSLLAKTQEFEAEVLA